MMQEDKREKNGPLANAPPPLLFPSLNEPNSFGRYNKDLLGSDISDILTYQN